MPLNYYLDQKDANHYLPRTSEFVSAPYRAGGGVEPEPDWKKVQQLSEHAARVWLIADEQNVPAWTRLLRTRAPEIRHALARNHRLAYQWRYQTFTVQRYDLSSTETQR